MFEHGFALDDDVIEVKQRFDDLVLAAVQRPPAGVVHRVGVIHRLCRLEPVVGTRDRGLVGLGPLEQVADEGRVDEGHVTGDHGGVLALDGPQRGRNARHRTLVGVLVEGELGVERVVRQRRLDSLDLVLAAVHDEFVDGLTQSVGDAANHRRASEVGDSLVAVAEPRRPAASDDSACAHTLPSRLWQKGALCCG